MARFSCKCSRCIAIRMPRLSRTDMFLSHFGYYPWECTECRALFYRRSRGPRTLKRSSRKLSAD